MNGPTPFPSLGRKLGQLTGAKFTPFPASLNLVVLRALALLPYPGWLNKVLQFKMIILRAVVVPCKITTTAAIVESLTIYQAVSIVSPFYRTE